MTPEEARVLRLLRRRTWLWARDVSVFAVSGDTAFYLYHPRTIWRLLGLGEWAVRRATLAARPLFKQYGGPGGLPAVSCLSLFAQPREE